MSLFTATFFNIKAYVNKCNNFIYFTKVYLKISRYTKCKPEISKVDLKSFIEKLSSYSKLDISDSWLKNSTLADKYDKNKNSIFEADELQAIKDDALKYANLDGNTDELSKEEAEQFFYEVFAGNNIHFTMHRHSKYGAYADNISDYDFGQDTIDLLSDLVEHGEKQKKDFILNKLEPYKDKIFCSSYYIEHLMKLPLEKLEIVMDFAYIEERGEDQFDESDLIELAKLNDKELEQAKKLFFVENREPQFSGRDLAALAKLTDKELEKAKKLFFVENRERQFCGWDLAALAKLTDKELEKAKKLFFVENREQQFSGWDIATLAKLTDKELEKAKKLFFVENREHQFDGHDIAELVKLSDEELEKAKRLFFVENRERQFDGQGIAALAKLSDEELEKAKKLFFVENREYQFSGEDIAALAKLSDEELEKAKTLFNIENRKRQFNGDELTELVKLSTEELKRAKKLFFVENRERQFNGWDIVELVELSDEEIEWARQYLFQKDISGSNIALIAKCKNKELENILSANNGQLQLEYSAGNSVKLKFNDKFYTFDKNGLIEEGTITSDDINDDNIQYGTITTVFNKKLNIKQEIIKGNMNGTSDTGVIFSEIITYYDDNNNVIRTVTLKRNPETGTLNVSEIDKNGNQIPIQWESINPENGAMITERHLTSPLGTKTDFFCENSEDLKITEYQITDTKGNVLVYVHQTFRQISDNKFISSVNTNPNDESDTQIYEIEYTKDFHVKVFDRKNNTTTDIDLNQYFTDAESRDKLLSTIKQLPGQVLLEFAEKPFVINYGESNIQNGYWCTSDSELQIGNYENTVGETANMFATLTHELGHFLDLYKTENANFADNPNLLEIYKREFEEFKKKTTSEQQKYIEYFTSEAPFFFNPNYERIAETHSILYSTEDPQMNMRRLYLAQYFPETMAAIMKLLLEEEGVKTQ